MMPFLGGGYSRPMPGVDASQLYSAMMALGGRGMAQGVGAGGGFFRAPQMGGGARMAPRRALQPQQTPYNQPPTAPPQTGGGGGGMNYETGGTHTPNAQHERRTALNKKYPGGGGMGG